MNYSTLSPEAEAHIAVFAWNDTRQAAPNRSGSRQMSVDGARDFQPSPLNFSHARTTKLEQIELANLKRGPSTARYFL